MWAQVDNYQRATGQLLWVQLTVLERAARAVIRPHCNLGGQTALQVKNIALNNAYIEKKDEFYTQLSDIEKEMRYYERHFKGKTVLCNCDDPRISNFFHYFSYNFEKLKLKKLITTCYQNKQSKLFSKHNSETAIYLEYDGDKNKNRVPDPDEIGIHDLNEGGDFRSEECIKILKKADIVVTNPPFSLFREYVAQLVKYKKKFIIIGNQNAITYKEIFSLMRDNKLWLGASIHSGDREFGVPDHYPLNASGFRVDEHGRKFIRVKGVRWFTNVDYTARHEDLPLYKKYNKTEYPKYDNYNAINVNKTKEIPMEYKGVMGVPITFLDKYNPNQFEIIGMSSSAGYNKEIVGIPFIGKKDARPIINGKNIYARIMIKHLKNGVNS